MSIVIVPATQQLIERFYGAPPPHTTKAVVAIDGEQIIGVGGVYAEGDRFVFYAEVTDALRAKKKTLVRAAKLAVDIAREYRGPVHAKADPAIPGSAALLEHIGFEHLEGDVYSLKGGQ